MRFSQTPRELFADRRRTYSLPQDLYPDPDMHMSLTCRLSFTGIGSRPAWKPIFRSREVTAHRQMLSPCLREDGFGDGRSLEKFQHDYPVLRVPGCTRRFRGDFDYRGRDLIYCDPPYLPSMRTSERRCRFEYQERDHIELLQLLKRSPCQVTLSGYPSAV